MSPAAKQTRLLQLDGLRGIAIILVILTHARLEPFFQAAPPIFRVILTMLANNGGMGVAVLFLLSGYLMATLYPQVPTVLDFWQKRYTRIFPAFLTMSLSLALVRFFWHSLTLWGILGLVTGMIVLAGGFWWLIRKLPQRQILGKALFKVFLATQALTAIGYVCLQWKVPSAVFLQIWPSWVQQGLTWLVNTTMTLPLGTYIAQLDGVYWSICAEVLFYLLYPRILLPFFQKIEAKKSYGLNILAILAMGPFLYGIDLISKSILGLQMLELHMAIFFVWGMLVSRLEHQSVGQKIIEKLKQLPVGTKLALSLFSGAALTVAPFVWRAIPVPAGIDSMLWSIPLVGMFFITVTVPTLWSKLLQAKAIVWLGSVSYALYLTHTLALEMFTRDGVPQTVSAAAETLAISLLTMGGLAVVLHYFLERPYFVDKGPKLKVQSLTQKKTAEKPWAWNGPLAVVISYLGLVWIAYRVPVSLLGKVRNHIQPELKTVTVLSSQPTRLTFTSPEANLGMILVHLKPLSGEQIQELGLSKGGETLAALRVKLLTAQGQQISQTDFPLYQIFESRFFTIGVPVQADSKNQHYSIELSTTSPLTSEIIGLISQGNSFRTVYFLPKTSYLHNPFQLSELFLEKTFQPFMEQTAWYALGLGFPLLGIAIYLSFPNKTNS